LQDGILVSTGNIYILWTIFNLPLAPDDFYAILDPLMSPPLVKSMKKNGNLFRLFAALLGLALIPTQSSLRASEDATIVLNWDGKFLKAIQNETTSPPLAARNLAVLHVAMFDAVNAIEKRFKPFHSSLTTTNPASALAAANAAGRVVSVGLFPSQRAEFEKLYNEFKGTEGDAIAMKEGIRVGEIVAREILEWRVADGVSTSVTYIPRNEPGAWRRTPPYFRPPELPAWKSVRPFAIKSCKEFRPAGPPALTSAAYAEDVNQVKELGGINSPKRTTEQTQIAKFWSDFSYTETPPLEHHCSRHTLGTSEIAHRDRAFIRPTQCCHGGHKYCDLGHQI
jgi:hypothetical protein